MPQPSILGALSDPQFYGDVKQRLVDALRGGVQDIFPTGAGPHVASAFGIPADPEYAQKLQNLALGALTVYHGSPHKFDAFDMSKIGTGEGAQAYGHGLYVAENPAVARSYAGLQPRPPAIMTEPNMYKADIPDEAVARMLDWDKPLSQQHPDVQDAIKTGVAKYHELTKRANTLPDTDEAAAAYDALMSERGKYSAFVDVLKRPDKYDGNAIYHALTGGSRELEAGKSIAASQTLSELGIPGIRYADAMSRGTGAGTSNFVLFDDKLARILERNQQPTGQAPWLPGEWKPQAAIPSQQAAAQLKQALTGQ